MEDFRTDFTEEGKAMGRYSERQSIAHEYENASFRLKHFRLVSQSVTLKDSRLFFVSFVCAAMDWLSLMHLTFVDDF